MGYSVMAYIDSNVLGTYVGNFSSYIIKAFNGCIHNQYHILHILNYKINKITCKEIGKSTSINIFKAIYYTRGGQLATLVLLKKITIYLSSII